MRSWRDCSPHTQCSLHTPCATFGYRRSWQMQSPSVAPFDAGSAARPIEERLERGEVVTFNPCPFILPDESDRTFLLQQHLHAAKKNISYNPQAEAVTGFDYRSDEQEDRLTAILKAFSLHV